MQRPWQKNRAVCASAYAAGATALLLAGTDVRTFRDPEYVVRRISVPGRLRRLRDVPHRSRRSRPDVRHDPGSHSPHRPRHLCRRRPRAARGPGRRRSHRLALHCGSVRGSAALGGAGGPARRRRHRRGGPAHVGAPVPQPPTASTTRAACRAGCPRPPAGRRWRSCGDSSERSRARTSPTASHRTRPTSRRR